MQKKTLGTSDIEISPMGMGCWAIGGVWWSGDEPLGWGKTDDTESIKAVHAGLDLGINFIDTANAYGAGHSEIVLGRALEGRRDKVVLATKFGLLTNEETKQIIGIDCSNDSIRSQLEDSLRRLKTDYLDLYQFHLNEHDIEDAARVRDLLEEFVKEGKIRYYGWSTDYPDRAKIFAEGSSCATAQFQCNVLESNDDMISLCEELQLTGINRGPLAMGILSGKYTADSKLAEDDIRGITPDWMKYFKDGVPSAELISKLDAIREQLRSDGRTLAQGALAWLWAKSPQLVPIPGFRNVEQITQNAAAMDFGPLDEQTMSRIDEQIK